MTSGLQAACVPLALLGRDICGSAQTGPMRNFLPTVLASVNAVCFPASSLSCPVTFGAPIQARGRLRHLRCRYWSAYSFALAGFLQFTRLC